MSKDKPGISVTEAIILVTLNKLGISYKLFNQHFKFQERFGQDLTSVDNIWERLPTDYPHLAVDLIINDHFGFLDGEITEAINYYRSQNTAASQVDRAKVKIPPILKASMELQQLLVVLSDLLAGLPDFTEGYLQPMESVQRHIREIMSRTQPF